MSPQTLTQAQARTFLLACISPNPNPNVLRPILCDPPIDWAALYRLADCHKMVGIIAPLLNELLQGALPETPEAPWRSRWRALAVRELSQRAALAEILLLTQAHGIQPIVIKGLPVHLQVYPARSVRGACDLDLLVQPSQLPTVVRCLESAGFALRNKDPLGQPVSHWSKLVRKTSEADYLRARDGIAVDLHWSLCAPIEERCAGITLLKHFWMNTRSLQMERVMCEIPGREEELLLVSLHLMRRGPFHLRGLYDLILLLESPPQVDWARLIHLARQTGTAATAFHAFELASPFCPGRLPQDVRDRLRPSSRLRWILSPSLRLDHLVKTQGHDRGNLGLRWKGVLFSQRPWIWLPYETALRGKCVLRKIWGVLR